MGEENNLRDIGQELIDHFSFQELIDHFSFQLAQQIASFAVFHKYIQLLYQIGSRFLR